MQISSKFLLRTAIALLGVMMAITVYVGVNNSRAEATNESDLAKVNGYVYDYINNQYGSGVDQGEAGFVIDAATLYNNLGSGTGIPGEGTDAATVPVLVDNYGSNGTWIPGTSIRCFWNTGADGSGPTQNCFDLSVVNAIKAKVDAHNAAGFSTDVIFYCVSGHTEAPTTGGMGYLAQAPDGLGTGITPKVLALKWGRNGWTNTIASYPNSGPLAAPNPPSTYTPPTSVPAATACNSSQGDAALMRCQAQWAIYNGTVNGMAGGNVGNGQSPNTTPPNSATSPTLATGQVVDIRSGGITQTVSGYNAVSISLDTLFSPLGANSGVNPNAASGVLVVSRTPMVGGIAAMGLKMLGYTMSTGGFMNGGIPKWNNSLDEKQVSDGQTRPALTSTAIDTAAPVVSTVEAINVTGTSADIHRVAGEPASMRIDYGTDANNLSSMDRNTVLNADKTMTLAGLTPNTTYYYQVSSFDGLANRTTSAVMSFTTGDIDAPVTTDDAPAGWQHGTVTVNLSCTDPNPGPTNGFAASGCKNTYYVLDGAPEQIGTTVSISGDAVHTLTYHSDDNAANAEYEKPAGGPREIKIDDGAPVVTYTGPTGTVNNNHPTITGTASDAVSGVVSATLSLNGGAPTPCNVDGSGNVNCPTSNLDKIGYTAVITATDAAGNQASSTAPTLPEVSFTVDYSCESGQPNLTTTKSGVYWKSYIAYVNRVLSVDYVFDNVGTTTANDVQITGVTTSNSSVVVKTAMPVTVAPILGPGESATATIQFKMKGTSAASAFNATVDLAAADQCGGSYAYQSTGSVKAPALP